MQTAVNRSVKRLSNSQPVSEIQRKKLLFVTPSNCGQLQIAKYFWGLYRPENCEAEFASLENAPINLWLKRSMVDYDYRLEDQVVPSVFFISTVTREFDGIISLGVLENYCSLSPFVETLDVLFGHRPKKLYWDIPDPEYLAGDTDELYQGAADIRNRIEFEIAQYSRTLSETN